TGAAGEALRSTTSAEAMLETFAEEFAREKELLAHCIHAYPTEVVLLGLSLLDLLGHYAVGEVSQIEQLFLRAYQEVDAWVGELLEAWAGPETTVWVASDHGMGPYFVNANVLRHLVDEGLLAFRGGPSPAKLRALQTAAALYLRLRSTGRPGADAGAAGSHEGQAPGPGTGGLRSSSLLAPVDWSRSALVPWGPDMLWVNEEGKYPEGCVDAAEREAVLARAERVLMRMRDPKSGRPLLQAVRRREELYWGPHADDGPDLVLVPSEGVYLQTGSGAVPGGWENLQSRDEVLWDLRNLFKPSVSEARPPRYGHRMEGVVMAWGAGIAQGVSLRGASLPDLAPSLLYTMGVPVPTSMDGHVLVQAFDPGRLQGNPITYTASAPPPRREQQVDAASDEDTRELQRRLQDLGYL
ncbi:MAG: alkaline phosphatase family protein, partial [Armatimonadetes bacterium]|nr:alkaline phosphatase family protein [Armatimonadota bacterium]